MYRGGGKYAIVNKMNSAEPFYLILYDGCILKINSGVYPPYYGSFLLERNTTVKLGEKVLDVGTGTGFFAIRAAMKGAAAVTATDVLEESVECAEQNAVLNGVRKKINVLRGNLFAPVKGKIFDVIFANVPILPAPRAKHDFMSTGRDGGKNGKEVLYRLLHAAPVHLKTGGRIYFTHFDFTDVHATMKKMEAWGLYPEILAEEDCPLSDVALERLDYLYSLMHPSPIHKKGKKFICKRYAVCGIKR